MDITKLKAWDEITLRNGLVGSFVEFNERADWSPAFYLMVLFAPGVASCVYVDKEGRNTNGIELFDVVAIRHLEIEKPHPHASVPRTPRKWWQL